MRLTLAAAELTAADTDERTLTYTLVPYGPVGQTSLGPVTAEHGTITIPEQLDRVKLLRGHDRETPVGHALLVDDTPAGLVGSFRVARTPAGDAALLDAAEKIRDGVSVELDDVELSAGRLVAGRLVAAAMVALPAWSDARLAAEHEPPTPPAAPAAAEKETPPMTTDTLTATVPATPAREPEQLRAAAATTRPRSPLTLLAQRIVGARLDGNSALLAALADVTPDGNGAGNETAGLMDQALGELWGGVDYQAKYRPLIAGGPLTGVTVHGWRWDTPPTVADYAGNKTPIPTNAAKLVKEAFTPERIAGGHDIDRIYRDLGDDAVLRSYWARMAESLAVQLDARALDTISTTAGAPTSAPDVLTAMVRGVLTVGRVGSPTFAIVADDLVEQALLVPAAEAPVGMSGQGIVNVPMPPVTPSDAVPAGTVIVGARQAARLLTFEPPVRIEAVNLPNGGIDAGLFSYSAGVPELPAGVVAFTVTPAPAAASEGRRGK